jgi:glycosyltransferase involved in cell wall biosynthesis
LLKILFIHEVSYRKKVIFEMHEFPELLALKGHEVSFLEFDEGRKFWSKAHSPRRETISGRVHPKSEIRLSRPLQVGIPGFDRALAVITAPWELRRLFKRNSFDVVVLYAVPTYGLQALWFARKHKVPVLFRALDVSHRIRNSLLSPIIKWCEKQIYTRVDLLSANNSSMAHYCSSLASRSIETVVHYPPLGLTHFQSGGRDEALRKSLGFTERDRVLVYMGSFFYFSGLPNAIRTFAKCVKVNKNIKLLLLGGGEQEIELRRLVESLGLENKVVFTGFINYKDLPGFLKIADVAINTLERSLVANTALPNKVLQYLSAGLPVVSTRLEGLNAVFQGEHSIAWELDADSVINRAVSLSVSNLRDMTPSNETIISLSRFDSDQTISLFEDSLMLLADGAIR